MKVWFKRVLITLVVVVIVALIGLAIFLLTFDPNAYKNKLQEIIYERYQRTLTVKGDIELSLFPRIGLSLQDVSLSDRNSTDTFASIDSARFAVAIWPLLSNRLVVDHVAVTGFKAWVIRNDKGEFNFQDLIERAPGQSDTAARVRAERVAAGTGATDATASRLPGVLTPPEASRADLHIDIAGLDLKGGEIHFYDAISGYVGRLINLGVNTGRMTYDQPFDVALSGRLLGELPVADATLEGQAVVRFNPESGAYSAQKLNVRMAGLLGQLQAQSATLQGNMAYNVYSNLLDVSNFELAVQGETKGEQPIKNLETSLTAPRLKVDRFQSEFRAEKLAFRARGNAPDQAFDLAFDAPSLSISPKTAKGDAVSGTVKLTGENVLGVAFGLSGLGGDAYNLSFKEVKIDGGLKQPDRLIQFNASSPARWNVPARQGGLSAIKGELKIEDAALPSGSFAVPLIGSVRADLLKDEVMSDINAVVNGSPLNFKLQVSQLEEPKAKFDLQAEAIDFNNFFGKAAKPAPAASGAEAPGKTAGQAQKPAPASAGKAPAAPAPASKIDLSVLDSVDLTGNIKLGELKVGDVQATDFSVAVRAVDGALDLTNIAATLYQGKLSGTMHATSKNEFKLKAALNGTDVGPLLSAFTDRRRVSGTGDLKLDLNSRGQTGPALESALSGTVQANVRDGAIQGINLEQTMREAATVVRNVFSGQVPDMTTQFDMGRQTAFSRLDLDLSFQNGQGQVKRLNLVAPSVRVSAGSPASIDLVNRQLDAVANVRVVNVLKGAGDDALAELQGVTVPVRVSGPFDALGYRVQWEEVSSRVVKEAVEHGLLDLISNKAAKEFFGAPAAPEAGQAEPAAPAKALDPVKSIGDALKGLLRQ